MLRLGNMYLVNKYNFKFTNFRVDILPEKIFLALESMILWLQ